jgi:predicted secreted Zn-dependent protease
MLLFGILRQVRSFGSAEMVSNLAKAITTYIQTLNANEQDFGNMEHGSGGMASSGILALLA